MPSDHSRPVVPVDGGHWPFPWPAVFELENTVGSQHWSLIGGLMVQLHCFANNVEPTRATTDIDTLVHVEIENQGSLNVLKSGLRTLGYTAVPRLDPRQPVHRFRREDDAGETQVDVLVADHVAPRVLDRLRPPTPVEAPGGTNALSRTQVFEVTHEAGVSRISTPDIVGALVLKSEAYRVDSRDRERHLMDAVTLALLLDGENSGTPLHGTASQRMRRLIRRLDDPRACDRAGLDRDDLSDAIIALEDLLDR